MSLDAKRTYDEGHLHAFLITNNAKAYANSDAYCYNARFGLHACAGPNAHTCNQTSSIPGQLRNDSAITNHINPCETIINQTCSIPRKLSAIRNYAYPHQTIISNASTIIKQT